MKKHDHTAAGFLLVAVGLAGRALLGLPEAVTIAEATLSLLCMIGAALLGKACQPAALLAIVGMALELALCANLHGGVWLWLWPALRAVDLLAQAGLLWVVTRRGQEVLQNGRYDAQCRVLRPTVLALCLAECALLGICALPAAPLAATIRSAIFIAYSLALLWGVILLIRAYRAAQKP